MSKGFFVTLEGGEGTGKSTLMSKLSEALLKRGLRVITTREPGGSPLSEHIRHWLLDNKEISVGDKAELLLFLAARAQHVEELIAPSLREGKVVICDRFNDSTFAYQGGARGFAFEDLENLCHFVCGDVWPNLTILLDIDPQKGLKRSTTNDRLESEEIDFHYKVRDNFLVLAEKFPERYVVIDATKTAEEVFQQAIEALEMRI